MSTGATPWLTPERRRWLILGVVFIAIVLIVGYDLYMTWGKDFDLLPAWLRTEHVDLRVIGVISASVMGCAIAGMHYTGMSSFVTAGHIEWEAATIGASVVLGVIGSILALLVAGDARTFPRQVLAGLTLTLAVCAMHFTGMGAMTIVPAFSFELIDAVTLPIAVSGTAMMTISACWPLEIKVLEPFTT